MLVEFPPIFVVDTKIIFRYDFVVPLKETYSLRGSNPQINTLGLLHRFLNDEPMAINPWAIS